MRNSFCAVFVVVLVLLHLYIFRFFNNSEQQQNLPNEIKINFGTINVNPPHSMPGHPKAKNTGIITNNDDHIAGCDILICKQIINYIQKQCPNKKITPVWKLRGHPIVFEALKEGEVDVALGGYSVTDERKERFDAVDYLNPGASMLVRKDDSRFLSFNDGDQKRLQELLSDNISDKKVTLSVFSKSLFVDIAKKAKEKYKTKVQNDKSYENSPKILESIKAEESDCFISDSSLFSSIQKEFPNQYKVFKLIQDDDVTIPPFGFFMKKGEENRKKIEGRDLKELFEEALDQEVLGGKFKDTKLRLTQLYEKRKNTPQADKDALENAIKEAEGKQKEIDRVTEADIDLINQELSKEKTFFGKIWKFLPQYQKPIALTLTLTCDSLLLGFALALILVKTKILAFNASKKSFFDTILRQLFSRLIDIMITFFQSAPLTVQGLVLWALLSPLKFFQGMTGLFYIASIVLLINTAIDLAGIMINHIKFLDKGQVEAGLALGMTDKQILKHITFRQAFKRTLPSIWNQIIINIKNTAVFMGIGLPGLVWQAEQISNLDLDYFTPYITIFVIYLILVLIIKLIAFLMKKNTIKK
ncbi:ABC transporter permease subunit [Candidatus Phytoplasma solani]|uniref:ABC transporter permease subunit n=1 Tax=Candidatus Phytoplasma solani TaxID=69896 RepID=UPI00358EA669